MPTPTPTSTSTRRRGTLRVMMPLLLSGIVMLLAACDRKPTDPMRPSDPVRSVPAPTVSRPAPSLPDTPGPVPMPPAAPASTASGVTPAASA